MNINLKINGKDKTFTTPFVSARMLRETMAMASLDGNNLDASLIDTMAEYIVKLFGNQFTLDDFYDGYPADKVISTFTEYMQQITGTLENKVVGLSKNE